MVARQGNGVSLDSLRLKQWSYLRAALEINVKIGIGNNEICENERDSKGSKLWRSGVGDEKLPEKIQTCEGDNRRKKSIIRVLQV